MSMEPTPPSSPRVCVITQLDQDGRTRRQTTADRYGPLALSSHTFFVFQSPKSTDVIGFVHLAELLSFHTTVRNTFRHPILGLVFALGLIASTPFIPSILIIVFFLLLGIFTLWEVVRNRKVVWLVLDTRSGRREFLLAKEITPEIQACLDTLTVICQTPSE
ncbi:MAG: hypothetical protein WCI73_18290 [Phycisphaerae bacterium]